MPALQCCGTESSALMRTFLLLSLCLLVLPALTRGQVLGDVVLYTDNYTFDPFPDLPADFGPGVPDDGIDGYLRVADPEDACKPFNFRIIDETWVALISRAQQLHPTNCTFDVKVRNAELAGAAAAIVYDDTYEALIIMSKPRDHLPPGIPAVFVSEKAGIIMRKLITPGQTRVRIVAVSASAWMSLVMSAFLGFMALTVVLATFYVMRSWSVWLGRAHGRRLPAELGFGGAGFPGQGSGQDGLPACAIHALPVLVYEGKTSRRRRSKGNVADSLPNTQAGAASGAVLVPSAPYTRAPGAAWLTPVPAPASTAHTATTEGQQPLSEPAAATPQGASNVRGRGMWQSSSRSSTGQGGAAGQDDLDVVDAVLGHGDAGVEVLQVAAATAPWESRPEAAAPAAAAAAPLGAAILSVSSPAPLPGSSTVGSRSGNMHSIGETAAAVAAATSASAVAAPVSPSSGWSSPLLSTDEEEEGNEAEPALLVSSTSGGGSSSYQHCIVTDGPVGARGGATRRTCVVCLERYHTGDSVRVLPCQHRFHASCIDPWLACRRLCPVCKHDASLLPPPLLQQQQQRQQLPADDGAAVRAGARAAGVAAAARGAVVPAAAGNRAALAAAAVTSGDPAGLMFLGQRYWFTRLRARIARAGRRQQAAAGVGVEVGMEADHVEAGLGSTAAGGAAQRLPAALSGVGAVAGLPPGTAEQDAAEAGGLLTGSESRAAAAAVAAAAAAYYQQQWQEQDEAGGLLQSRRQPALMRPLSWQRRLLPPADLGEPLLDDPQGRLLPVSVGASIGTGSSRSRTSRLLGLLPSSAAVPIPQLTPVHSDASSAGSFTAASQSLRSSHSVV